MVLSKHFFKKFSFRKLKESVIKTNSNLSKKEQFSQSVLRMEQIEASKPVSVQMNLSDHLKELPMQSVFGDSFFRGEGVFGLLCFEVFVLYCWGVFGSGVEFFG